MAFCAELVRPAAETRHVRLRDWLEKRRYITCVCDTNEDGVVMGQRLTRLEAVLCCAVLCFSSGRDAVVFGTNWHRRYVVLANNVLFVYASPKVLSISHMYSVLVLFTRPPLFGVRLHCLQDLKPKKVILLDDVVVLVSFELTKLPLSLCVLS